MRTTGHRSTIVVLATFFPMMPLAVLTSAGLIGVALVAAPPEVAARPVVFIDLAPKSNQNLNDQFGRIEGNNLASLPTGLQTFADVKFNVDSKILQLASERLPVKKADRIEAIAVNRKASKIHFLHGTVFGNSKPAISDDTLLAEYTIHYDDGSTAKVPVVYGEDVRDWISPEECRVVRRGKIGWVGDNSESKRLGRHIYLYITTWENLAPQKRITAIDYAKMGDNLASPFCVAITTEE